MKFFSNILGSWGSFASIIGLLFVNPIAYESLSPTKKVIVIICIVLLIISVIATVINYIYNKPKVFKSERSVKEYLHKWIQNGGRTVIFTRDMSWVDDSEIKSMLKRKAEDGELMILMPKKIDKVEEFASVGAKIVEYPDLQFTPRARFTITNFGRADAKIAVGKRISSGNKFKHQIEEYDNGSHPYFQLADDLVHMIMKKEMGTHVG